ncbi:MAG: hypothetical protein V1746_03430 [bacterium]
MSVKIVRLRQEGAEDSIPPQRVVFNENGSSSTSNVHVAHRLPVQMDGRSRIHRFDEDTEKTDVSVLLPSGEVIAIPEQVFRGRVAFKFGRRKNKLLLVCAWCGKSLGEAESEIEGVSHGMCQECFDKITAAGLLHRAKATSGAN